MRCFGPSASQEARHRRDELEEAFGEGYDEAEEARIFALEELARQQSELEEAFGEGYDPEEEARLFAEEDAVPPAAPPEAPLDFVRGNGEGSLTFRRRDASEDECKAPPATVATSPRETPKALRLSANDESARVTTLEPSREVPPPEEPRTKAPETEPPRRDFADASPNAPKKPREEEARRRDAAKPNEGASTFVRPTKTQTTTNEMALPSFSSLPPLDLGDPEKYRRLRETLGVEAALRVPLAQLLKPLEATETEQVSKKGNPDLFVPQEMPVGLLLPFAQHEAYGKLKLREIRQEDGSVGYATLAADGDGKTR